MEERLTSRQQRFVSEYVVCANAAEAARRAGYSGNGAKVTACRLLTNPNLKAAIAEAKRLEARKLELRKEHIIAAVLEAIQLARAQAEPAAMIRGLVEIAKMLGFYDPEIVESKPLSEAALRIKNKYETMPTNELLELIAAKSMATQTD